MKIEIYTLISFTQFNDLVVTLMAGKSTNFFFCGQTYAHFEVFYACKMNYGDSIMFANRWRRAQVS